MDASKVQNHVHGNPLIRGRILRMSSYLLKENIEKNISSQIKTLKLNTFTLGLSVRTLFYPKVHSELAVTKGMNCSTV